MKTAYRALLPVKAGNPVTPDRAYGCWPPRLRGSPQLRLIQRRHGPQICHDGIEIVRRERCVVLIAHRRLELAAVFAHALSDRALDFIVSPGTDAFGLAWRDI